MHDHTSEETAAIWMADGNCRNYPPAAFFPSDGVGVDRARKIRDLVHTIRCQGDLTRVAAINVRFKKPYFTLR